VGQREGGVRVALGSGIMRHNLLHAVRCWGRGMHVSVINMVFTVASNERLLKAILIFDRSFDISARLINTIWNILQSDAT
jgi:hypothetical protein